MSERESVTLTYDFETGDGLKDEINVLIDYPAGRGEVLLIGDARALRAIGSEEARMDVLHMLLGKGDQSVLNAIARGKAMEDDAS